MDNLHSQIVGWSKIILPLCALGLLSTLFLFARSDRNQEPEIPVAQINEMAREQRVSAPQFSGVTAGGQIVTVSAKEARPDTDQADRVSVDDIYLKIDYPNGETLEVVATAGDMDGGTRVARLTGLARLETSTGYGMETTGLIAELDTGMISSTGMLEIRAPLGEVTAGKVQVQLNDAGSGQHILFTGGVRLLYKPQG